MSKRQSVTAIRIANTHERVASDGHRAPKRDKHAKSTRKMMMYDIAILRPERPVSRRYAFFVGNPS